MLRHTFRGLRACPAHRPDVYNALRTARSAIVFVNTRAQAELCFHALWRLNDDNLAIALHLASRSGRFGGTPRLAAA